MNILVIPSWYENKKNKTHGSFFKEQAKGLADLGHNVYILYVDIIRFNEIDRIINTKKYNCYEDSNLKVYRKKVIKIPRIPEKYVAKNVKNGVIDLYKKFIKDKVEIDVIHAHSFIWGGYAGVELSSMYNIPIMVTEHYSGYGRNLFGKDEEEIIRYSMKSSDKIVTVSNGLKKRIEKYTSSNISVIPNMVDDKIFNIEKLKYNEFKDKFRYFTVAYLNKGKGIDILIRAFKNVIDVDCNCELIIGGDGVEKNNLKQLVKELNIQKNVKFLGLLSRNEVADNMKKCDCFVLPSRYETFGVVYIEALACGKPVIATKTDAIDDIVNKDNGVIVKIDDINDLTRAMIEIKEKISNYKNKYISQLCIQKFGRLNVIKNIEEKLKELKENKKHE